MKPDCERAQEITQAWYVRAASFDQKVAIPEVRAFLARHSWSDGNFANQSVGLVRCLAEIEAAGFDWRYDWVLCRDGYDFTPEPVYQYLVLSALLGMWRDLPQEFQSPKFVTEISARQTDGWVLNARRAEPLGAAPGIGWVQIPFAWDDMLKTAIDGWMAAPGLDHRQPLGAVCEVLGARPTQTIDWSIARPWWNSLLLKGLAGHLKVHPFYESAWVAKLCTEHPLLRTEVLHQQARPGPDVGLSLAQAATAYTVAHETAHVIQTRCGVRFSGEGSDLARESDADVRAMGALWNDAQALGPEVREGQSYDLLWFASGLIFYFALLVFANVRRSVDVIDVRKAREVQASLGDITARWRNWSDLAGTLAESLARRSDGEAVASYAAASKLLPSLAAFANELLTYGRSVMPAALPHALTLHQAFLDEHPAGRA